MCKLARKDDTKKDQTNKKPNYKIVFLLWSSKHENEKKNVFAKFAKHHLCLEGRQNGIFMHTLCFGQKIFKIF